MWLPFILHQLTMKKVFLLMLGVASLSACKKDSEPTPTASSRTDLLLAKNWRLSAQTTTFTSAATNGIPAMTNVADVYATYYGDACKRDNSLKFNSNKTIVMDEGATKCSASDPQTQAGTWNFNSDETKLTLVDPAQGGTLQPFDVVELSATTLRLRHIIVTNGGVLVTSTNDITFTAL